MPARLSSMELSDPATSEMDAISRRKSGRATQKPALYQQDPNISIGSNGSGKRKRAQPADIESDEDDAEEESSPDESEGDPDEEELKEKRRASRAKSAQKKPAVKKSKVLKDSALKLPMRPATNGVKRVPKLPRKPRARQNTDTAEEGSGDTGLYGEIGDTESCAWVMANWIRGGLFSRTYHRQCCSRMDLAIQ